jgi:E2/UBC family protein E
MTADDFEAHLRRLGFKVEALTGADNLIYIVIRSITVPSGALRGRTCDVAILRGTAVPYVPPAAIHTNPALVPMNSAEPLGTQVSTIGPGWQYWSRRYERPVNPARLWAHILTVLCDDRWPTN